MIDHMKLPWYFLAFVSFFVYSHLLISYGAIRERESKLCLDPAQMRAMHETLEVTRAICVEGARERISELKAEIDKQKANARYWQKRYEKVATSTP